MTFLVQNLSLNLRSPTLKVKSIDFTHNVINHNDQEKL